MDKQARNRIAVRKYEAKNKEKIKQRREKNKEYYKQYRQSPKGKKSRRICDWKRAGILCFDYDLLYDIFLSTKRCEFCDIELTEGICMTTRCLDHDHSITDRFNVRGVLCGRCNLKDVLKL